MAAMSDGDAYCVIEGTGFRMSPDLIRQGSATYVPVGNHVT
jgi:hypothetical protein